MIAFALLLLALLSLREITRVSIGPSWPTVTRWLTIGIIPLFIIFLGSVALQLAQIFWQ